MINSKRGDIPITILVIGVFLVCTITFASFIYANSKFKSGFYGLNIMEEINSNVEQFYTYLALGKNKQEAANLIGAEYNAQEDIVIITKEIQDTNFNLWLKGEWYTALKITKTFKP